MSWAEAKWTVGQVNEAVNDSEFGKDLYISGIKKGVPAKVVSGSVSSGNTIFATITGKGYIVGVRASASKTYSDNSPSSNVTVTVDNAQTLSSNATVGTSNNITFDGSNLAGVDVTKNISGPNVINMPVIFNNGFSARLEIGGYMPSSGNTAHGSVEYILLDDGGGA